MNNNVLNQHSNILRPSIDTTVTKEYSTDCDGLLVPSEILDANGQSLTVNSDNNMMEPDTYENDFDGREEANIQPQQSGGPPHLMVPQKDDQVSQEAQMSQSLRRPGAPFQNLNDNCQRRQGVRRQNDSIREEEVNETFEEYESLSRNLTGLNNEKLKHAASTSTGLHARMAKLASTSTSLKEAGILSKLQKHSALNFHNTTRIQQQPVSSRQTPKYEQLQLNLTGTMHPFEINSHSANCSPAMGGRKTIMNLPNRLHSAPRQTEVEAVELIEGPAEEESLPTPQQHSMIMAMKTATISQNLVTNQSIMNQMQQESNSRSQLASITEQNESSKHTSKIDSSVHHFLSSMITMRSLIGPNGAGNYTQQKTREQSASPSRNLISHKQSPNQDVQKGKRTDGIQKIYRQPAIQVNNLDKQSSKKQYPTRVTINLDNPGPKPLPPIVTSSSETLLSQSQLTLQQKNFTFNETPSSAQQQNFGVTSLNNLNSPKNPQFQQKVKQYRYPEEVYSSSSTHQQHIHNFAARPPIINQPNSQSQHNSLTRLQPSKVYQNDQMAPDGMFNASTRAWMTNSPSQQRPNIQPNYQSPILKKVPKQLSRQSKNKNQQTSFKRIATNVSTIKQQKHLVKSKTERTTPQPTLQMQVQQMAKNTNIQSMLMQQKQLPCKTTCELARSFDYFSLSDRNAAASQLAIMGNTATKVQQTKSFTQRSSKRVLKGSGKKVVGIKDHKKIAKMAANAASREQVYGQGGARLNLLENIIEESHNIDQNPQQQSATQQMQTPLFGNRAATAPFTKPTYQTIKEVSNQVSQEHQQPIFIEPRGPPNPAGIQGAPLVESQTVAANEGSEAGASPFHNYLLLQRQSQLIGQIRKDIQSRKVQQDKRAEIISRILAEQEHQRSLISADGSNMSLMSRDHRRSLSASHSYHSQIPLDSDRVVEQPYKDQIHRYNQQANKMTNNNENTTSSFVSSLACSFVVEKEGVGSNAVTTALNLMHSMPVISPHQQRSQTTSTLKQQQAAKANLSAQLNHYLEQHRHHAKQFSYGCYPGAGVSSESLNALQSYYGGATTAALAAGTSVDSHQNPQLTEDLLLSSRTGVTNNVQGQQAIASLNQKVMRAHMLNNRTHASSQSQAVVQSIKSSKKKKRSHKESTQHGQKRSSQLTSGRKEQSSSQINVSPVYGNKRSFGLASSLNKQLQERVFAGGSKTSQVEANGGGGISTSIATQFLHLSPIEQRSRTAGSGNMLHAQDQNQQPFAMADQLDDSHQNQKEEETMLLETAGFPPLQNLTAQLQVNQIETANSSERPPHKKLSGPKGVEIPPLQISAGAQSRKVAMLPNAQQRNRLMQVHDALSPTQYSKSGVMGSQRIPQTEALFAQQQGFVPSEHQEKGVQTTTSFLEVSICKTPKGEPRSRNGPGQLVQPHTQPLTGVGISSQAPKVQLMSHTCHIGSFKQPAKATTQRAPKSTKIPFNLKETATGDTKVRTPKQLNSRSRCILTSGATKTNLNDLPKTQLQSKEAIINTANATAKASLQLKQTAVVSSAHSRYQSPKFHKPPLFKLQVNEDVTLKKVDSSGCVIF